MTWDHPVVDVEVFENLVTLRLRRVEDAFRDFYRDVYLAHFSGAVTALSDGVVLCHGQVTTSVEYVIVYQVKVH